MRRSQCIANECGKTSIVVSYDLAKIAMQIQAEESPKFDDIFVALGSFHIELAFFSAMGKIVSESGAPHLLTECGIFQKGSLNGFLKGKHYNRCKRFHEYLSLSLEYLHFESFLETLECQDNIICIIHSEVKKVKEDKYLEEHNFQGRWKMCLTIITNIRQLPWMKSMEKRPNFRCSMSKCTIFVVTSEEVYVLEI